MSHIELEHVSRRLPKTMVDSTYTRETLRREALVKAMEKLIARGDIHFGFKIDEHDGYIDIEAIVSEVLHA